MKRKLAFLVLLVMMTVTFVSVVDAALHTRNPNTARCGVGKNGKEIMSKDCDPTVCNCLFHQIEEYIARFFK